ncbi:MAG: phospholipase, partial [Bryobacteraceae bacterium]
VELTVDGQPLTVPRGGPLSFRKTAGRWQSGRYVYASGEKRPGLEGPMGEAIAGRHVYVYGSVAAACEDIENRRRLAAEAADWSSPRGRLLVSFRVVADKELSEADFRSSNLIVFGDRATNLVVARLADRLPVELNAGASDYGLIFVAPAGERLVVINSGLPFWSGAERARRPGFAFVPLVPRLLDSFPDFVLFKGSLENVVAEGRFDRNWKLPPEAAARMLATGAVRIR